MNNTYNSNYMYLDADILLRLERVTQQRLSNPILIRKYDEIISKMTPEEKKEYFKD